MDPTTESETPILTFDEEIGVPAADRAKKMLEAPEVPVALPPAPEVVALHQLERESDTDRTKKIGRNILIAVAVVGGIVGISLVGQTIGNVINHADTVAQATDAHTTKDSIATAIENASEGQGEGAQPIATFTLDADTQYISTGVVEFKNDPNTTYATESDEEKNFDDMSLNLSGKHLNATNPSNPGETYGIFNDTDLDGDGDTDLHFEKIDPASTAPVVDQIPSPETH